MIRRLSLVFVCVLAVEAAAVPPVRLEPLVTEGVSLPVHLAVAPGVKGVVYVVEQGGRVLSLDRATLRLAPFFDIKSKVVSGGEAGLLGIAFHPGYAANGRFFVAYTARRPRFSSILAEYRRGSLEEKELLRIEKPFMNHNGGQVAFGPDGFLYLSTGDGGSGGDPDGNGQSKKSLLGKILRFDVDRGTPYAIPGDNPFAAGGDRPEIFAYGLRNAWRFTFDRLTGAIFAGDVGQNRLEEIDLVVKGGNYGWNTMEGTECFKPAQGCDKTGLIPPIFEYGRDLGISITGGFVYRGTRIPGLEGHYLYADYGTGRLWALRYNQATRLVEGNDLLLETSLAISTFGEDEGGEILVADHLGGVYQLVR